MQTRTLGCCWSQRRLTRVQHALPKLGPFCVCLLGDGRESSIGLRESLWRRYQGLEMYQSILLLSQLRARASSHTPQCKRIEVSLAWWSRQQSYPTFRDNSSLILVLNTGPVSAAMRRKDWKAVVRVSRCSSLSYLRPWEKRSAPAQVVYTCQECVCRNPSWSDCMDDFYRSGAPHQIQVRRCLTCLQRHCHLLEGSGEFDASKPGRQLDPLLIPALFS